MKIYDMDFSEALRQLKLGSKITRQGWNKENIYLEIQYPEVSSKINEPYLIIVDISSLEHKTPWQPTSSDLLANDWGEADLKEFYVCDFTKLTPFSPCSKINNNDIFRNEDFPMKVKITIKDVGIGAGYVLATSTETKQSYSVDLCNVMSLTEEEARNIGNKICSDMEKTYQKVCVKWS